MQGGGRDTGGRTGGPGRTQDSRFQFPETTGATDASITKEAPNYRAE